MRDPWIRSDPAILIAKWAAFAVMLAVVIFSVGSCLNKQVGTSLDFRMACEKRGSTPVWIESRMFCLPTGDPASGITVLGKPKP